MPCELLLAQHWPTRKCSSFRSSSNRPFVVPEPGPKRATKPSLIDTFRRFGEELCLRLLLDSPTRHEQVELVSARAHVQTDRADLLRIKLQPQIVGTRRKLGRQKKVNLIPGW
jgi:hypothetical protein